MEQKQDKLSEWSDNKMAVLEDRLAEAKSTINNLLELHDLLIEGADKLADARRQVIASEEEIVILRTKLQQAEEIAVASRQRAERFLADRVAVFMERLPY